MVDDDDSDESPSPEPRTDSRSALPREIRAWRQLRVVKRDETFSLIFSSTPTPYICVRGEKNQREEIIVFYDTEPPPSPNLSREG